VLHKNIASPQCSANLGTLFLPETSDTRYYCVADLVYVCPEGQTFISSDKDNLACIYGEDAPESEQPLDCEELGMDTGPGGVCVFTIEQPGTTQIVEKTYENVVYKDGEPISVARESDGIPTTWIVIGVILFIVALTVLRKKR
jgi:hypothetical protein